RLARAVDRRRRAEFLDLRGQLRAVRQHHRDLGLSLELGAGEGGGRGRLTDPFLAVRPLPLRDAPGFELRLDARLLDRLLLQLVRDPGRQALGRIHDVRVGDDIAATVDEPAGARLDVAGRGDRDRAPPAVQGDVAANPGGDQHDGGLDAQDGFLDRVRGDAYGSTEPGTRQEEPEHQGSHDPPPYHGGCAAYNDGRCHPQTRATRCACARTRWRPPLAEPSAR